MAYYSGPRRHSRSGFAGRTQKQSHYKHSKARIDPSLFIKAAKPAELSEYIPTHNFSDFELVPLLKSNLIFRNFLSPSPIQDQAIPAGLSGRDVIGMANTGTGKTLAFALPVLNSIITNGGKSLIIAPTRELAEQIENEFRRLAKNSGIFGALLIGGTPITPQIRELKNNPSIVIGTPGRILDHLTRNTLNLTRFNLLVLDEVDRMLDMGFVEDIKKILSKLSSERQSFFFSATMGSDVIKLIGQFSKDPVTISVKTGDTSDNVEQGIVQVSSPDQKIEKLHDLLISEEVSKALVFDETHARVDRLNDQLRNRGFSTDSIHGGMSQSQRKRALNRFKSSEVTILIATDVAARGLNVSDISHVINYSTPQSYDDYIHRIGRAGRAGRKGYALTFVDYK